jgi:hypothetical protein
VTSSRAAIYRITPDPAAPSLRILSHDMGIFDGTPTAPLSPRAASRGTITAPPSPTQFQTLAPGILATSEDAWQDQNRYYCCVESGESLAITTEHGHIAGINVGPVWNASDTRDVGTMSDAQWRASFSDTGTPNIVRIGRQPTDLFCISGVGPEEDQFKSIYEAAMYQGLVFELVWQDPGADAQ